MIFLIYIYNHASTHIYMCLCILIYLFFFYLVFEVSKSVHFAIFLDISIEVGLMFDYLTLRLTTSCWVFIII